MKELTDVAPKVRLHPPPPALMRMVNPLIRRVLKFRPIGRRIELQALLEFDGRRSGRRRRVPVCLHDVDGIPTVFTERPWRLNFADGADVTVTHRGKVRSGRARLVDATPQQVGAAMRIAMDNGASPFELGLKVQRGHHPTAEELTGISRSLIRITFDEGA